MSSAKTYTDILSLLQQRSPDALDVLYKQYGRRLLSYALRRWHLSDLEIEEVLYETLYVLILKANNLQFSSQAQFDSYIYTVYANKLHEQFRKSRRANRHELIYSDEVMNPGEESDQESIKVPFPEAAITQYYEPDGDTDSPLVIRMQEALTTLTPIDRDLLELWGQGYTYEEIGHMLQVDSKHLKVKCFRAKQKIVKWFNENN